MTKLLNLDWVFEAVLQPKQEQLRQKLKARVAAWATKRGQS